MAEHVISVPLITDLKAQPGNTENIVMTVGQAVKGDALGALYWFDSSDSSTAEDNINWNTVVPNNNIGRWKKVITRAIILPHGNLFMYAGKREFFCNSVTAADGTSMINLTMDNTTNGTAIFSEVYFDSSIASVDTLTANDAVSSCRKTLSANKKQLTHLFYRGNAVTLNLGIITAGLTTAGFRSAATGTPVSFMVTGK